MMVRGDMNYGEKQSVKSKNLCNQPEGKMVREDTNHGDIK